LKVFNPADVNSAWMTTVAAISAAAMINRTNMQFTHFAAFVVIAQSTPRPQPKPTQPKQSYP
jgi:hypothetical protein